MDLKKHATELLMLWWMSDFNVNFIFKQIFIMINKKRKTIRSITLNWFDEFCLILWFFFKHFIIIFSQLCNKIYFFPLFHSCLFIILIFQLFRVIRISTVLRFYTISTFQPNLFELNFICNVHMTAGSSRMSTPGIKTNKKIYLLEKSTEK